MSEPPPHLRENLSLFERSARVIPGGIYGHTSPAAGLPGALPYFAREARGCRYIDADGRGYLDFMCGYGPNLLGYQNPEVEAAAAEQRARGNVFNHPTERMVELAEMLAGKIDLADWAVFGKNGSDMTTWALQVAREHTGRAGVAKVVGAYHGVDAWCTPGHGGLIPEDRAHVHEFAWNDLNQFRDLLRQRGDSIACVFLTPFHHPAFAPSVLPADGFFAGLQQICAKYGVLIVLDDVRAGFRLHSGGSHRRFGLEPDLACYCKALGNGYPISATVGREELRKAASKVFLTGSYWNNAVPQAAALKTMEIAARDRVVEHLERLGNLLAQGLSAAARRHGFDLRRSGPPAMPFFHFAGDENFFLLQAFAEAAARRGAFFHPHHNWFLCAAHDEQAIEEAIAIADGCLAELRQVHGP